MAVDASDRFDGETPLDPVTEEALAHLVRLHSGTATAQDRAAYETWKASDPAHTEAAVRAERLWSLLGPTLARSTAQKRRRSGLAAILLVALSLPAAFAGGLFGAPATFFADERTGVGERRSVTLADGSRVDLDTSTSFDVADDGRRLVLHAGQIHVSVARDPIRPFRVESGAGAVEALGTAFEVRRDGRRSTVAVTENAVRVTLSDADQRTDAETVLAGQETAFGPETGIETVRRVDLGERTAWRQGQLRFSEKPLGEVLDELGRYRRGAVLFTDDVLRGLPVTGVFSIDDPDALLDAVSVALPVRVRRLPWLTIVQHDPDRPIGRGRMR